MRDFQAWYDALNKPSWTPSPNIIGAIWTILYPIIFGVNIYVIYKFIQKEISFLVLLPFIINLIFNFAFTPVQFGLRNLNLATFVIIGVWLTIIWCMIAIWPHNQTIALLFLPYLIWVTIASVLQISISLKN